MNFQMFKLDLEKAEEPEIKLPTSIGSLKKWESSRKPATTATAESLQSCPTPCDPIDGSPRGSPIPGTLQARTLEWVAISFSNAWKWKVKVKSLGYFCFIDYAKAFDCVDQNKPLKILKEMGITDHLTCLLRNMYPGQEATVRTGHGTQTGSKLGKEYVNVVCCHPAYLTSMQSTSCKMLG